MDQHPSRVSTFSLQPSRKTKITSTMRRRRLLSGGLLISLPLLLLLLSLALLAPSLLLRSALVSAATASPRVEVASPSQSPSAVVLAGQPFRLRCPRSLASPVVTAEWRWWAAATASASSGCALIDRPQSPSTATLSPSSAAVASLAGAVNLTCADTAAVDCCWLAWTCSRPGAYWFQLSVMPSLLSNMISSVRMPVLVEPLEGRCHRWAMSTDLQPATTTTGAPCCALPSNGDALLVYVWVERRRQGLAQHSDNNDNKPSVDGLALTRAFYEAGERPLVTFDADPYAAYLSVNSAQWLDDRSVWAVSVRVYPGAELAVPVVVRAGTGVAFVGCAAEDTPARWSLYVPRQQSIGGMLALAALDDRWLSGAAAPAVGGGAANGRLFSQQHACATNRLLLWSDLDIYTSAATQLTDYRFWCMDRGVVAGQWGASDDAAAAAAGSYYGTAAFTLADVNERVRAVSLLDNGGFMAVTNQRIAVWTDGVTATVRSVSGLPADYAAWIQAGASVSVHVGEYCEQAYRQAILYDFPVVRQSGLTGSAVAVSASGVSATPYILYSVDNGQTFDKYSLASYVTTRQLAGVSVLDVVVQPLIYGCAVLVREYAQSPTASNANYTDRVLLVENLFRRQSMAIALSQGFAFDVQTANFTAYALLGGPMQYLQAAANGGPGLFVYGTGLYYSADGGHLFFPLSVGYTIAPISGSLQAIQQVAVSRADFFAVLTADNRLFVGREGLLELTELSTGLSSEVASVSFTVDVRLYLHLLPGQTELYLSAASLSNRTALSLEILYGNQIAALGMDPQISAQYTALGSCPYSDFSTTLPSRLFLDIGASAQLSTNLTSTADWSAFSYGFFNASVLSYQSIASKSSLVSLGSNVDAIQRIDSIMISGRSSMGRASVRIGGNGVTLACADSAASSVVQAGCVPGSLVQPLVDANNNSIMSMVATSAVSACQLSADGTRWTGSFTFDIPAYKYVDTSTGNVASVAKTVVYNCTLYGPPIAVNYGDPFVPNLGVFQRSVSTQSDGTFVANTTFVNVSTADMIMWEINGRTPTYKYAATQQSAGCVRPAQSWSAATAAWRNVGSPLAYSPFDLWTQDLYADCTVNDGNSPPYLTADGDWQSAYYEIVSQQNPIDWMGRLEGIYVFQVRIIDPQFSFCDYTTYLAVSVYGAPLSSELQAATILSVIGTFLLILGSSYFFFRRQHQQAVRDLQSDDAADARALLAPSPTKTE